MKQEALPWFFVVSIKICFLWMCFGSAYGDRTGAKIYEPISGALACFRRMNKTHQIGCSSQLTGNVGVLHLVDSDKSLKWVTTDGPHSPYVVIIDSQNFVSQNNMRQLRDSGRVSGVLLLYNNSRTLKSFSGDTTCPNRGYGLYTNESDAHYCESWNEQGTGLLYEDWGFPMFYVNDEAEAEKLTECFNKFNAEKEDGVARDWPLCAAQLESHMLAAVNSETCIRRENVFSLQPSRICDPLGGYNVWGSLFPRSQQQAYTNRSVIVIAARADASSMFDKLTPGADSAVTATTALLSTIKHLSSIQEELKASKTVENIYFMLFSGEAFDYIGSSRIVYDMKGNRFPSPVDDSPSNQTALLKLEHIKYFIELSQVGLDGDNVSYYVHSVNTDPGFITKIKSQGAEVNVSIAEASSPASKGLPPTSVQSFLAQQKDLPGIVITNYDTKFKNKFYNSIYDDADSINFESQHVRHASAVQGRIAALSAALARTVATIAIPEQTSAIDSIKPDADNVNDLLYCFLDASNCTIFKKMIGHDQLPAEPFSLYVGVYNHLNPLSILTRNLLATYQGVNVSKSLEDCKRDTENQTVDYLWINEACYETTVNVSLALSPAFQIDGRISWDEWNTGLYSTWTESVWQKFTVRIFLKPSRLHEISTLVSGIIVFLISLAVVGWASKKSDVIFQSRPDVIC